MTCISVCFVSVCLSIWLSTAAPPPPLPPSLLLIKYKHRHPLTTRLVPMTYWGKNKKRLRRRNYRLFETKALVYWISKCHDNPNKYHGNSWYILYFDVEFSQEKMSRNDIWFVLTVFFWRRNSKCSRLWWDTYFVVSAGNVYKAFLSNSGIKTVKTSCIAWREDDVVKNT